MGSYSVIQAFGRYTPARSMPLPDGFGDLTKAEMKALCKTHGMSKRTLLMSRTREQLIAAADDFFPPGCSVAQLEREAAKKKEREEAEQQLAADLARIEQEKGQERLELANRFAEEH